MMTLTGMTLTGNPIIEQLDVNNTCTYENQLLFYVTCVWCGCCVVSTWSWVSQLQPQLEKIFAKVNFQLGHG
jgi:hypothetical protein